MRNRYVRWMRCERSGILRGSPLLTIIFAEAGRTAILVLAMLAELKRDDGR